MEALYRLLKHFDLLIKKKRPTFETEILTTKARNPSQLQQEMPP